MMAVEFIEDINHRTVKSHEDYFLDQIKIGIKVDDKQ